jgi:branched-chain amino acid transport system permease protein
MLAGLFGSVTIFLRSALVGVPNDATLGFGVLLFVLAAAVVARMENIPLALAAGMAVGVLGESAVFKSGSNDFSSAIMLAVVLVALLLQRGQLSRAFDTGVSTWQAVKEFRPIPKELRDVREVVTGRSATWVVVVALALGAPFLVTPGQVGKLTLIPIYAIVAISMVVLTGWAGQISLGQFGLVGAGAAAAGGLAADHNIDLFAAIFIGIAAGAILATIIGIPALRVPGLYLAVTTLAFGGAMQYYFLNKRYWIGQHVLPHGEASRILRPMLLQRIDLADDRTYYWLCLVFLGLALLAARAFRHNRSGRILIAVRDNQRAAPAYAINLARTKLAAFAISGALAALAGVLLAYQQRNVDPATYGISNSILIFLIAVIGGLTSLSGAVVGTVGIMGIYLLIEPHFKGAGLLATGPGLLLILLFLPGGFAQGLYQGRDSFLRWVAKRHDLLVPSLVADRRETDPLDAGDDAVTEAEHHVEEVESFDVFAGGAITCPVCGEAFTPEAAVAHEHFHPVAAGSAGAAAGGAARLAQAKEGRR